MPPPLAVSNLCNLISGPDGVPESCVNHRGTTVESCSYVCVQENKSDEHNLAIFDLRSGTSSRMKMAAVGSAVMHLTRSVVAVVADDKVQVFDLAERKRVGGTSLPETVVMITWVDEDTLGVVTEAAVYHWRVQESASAERMFIRDGALAGGQAIAFKTDSSRRWMALVCLVAQGQDARDGVTPSVKGVVQLWSADKAASKVLDGHAVCFASYPAGGSPPCTLLCVASSDADGGRLTVVELPTSAKPTPTFEKQRASIDFQSPADFPVALASSTRFGALTLVTLMGQCRVYDIATAKEMHRETVSEANIFASADLRGDGLMCVGRNGCVLSVRLDEETYVGCVEQHLGPEAAMAVAVRGDLPGAEELFAKQFDTQLSSGEVAAALRTALGAPRSQLRTEATLQRLQQLPQVPHQPSPLRMYFQAVTDRGKLNSCEGVELAKIVLAKEGGTEYIKKLMEDGKIELTEALGDLLEPLDSDLALRVYGKGRAHDKVISVLLRRQQYPKVVEYARRMGPQCSPVWKDILIDMIATNPDGAAQLALLLHAADQSEITNIPPPLSVVEVFVERSCMRQVTQLLLEILKRDPEAENRAELQTRLLEVNLTHSAPHVADGLLGSGVLKDYDAAAIAPLCERAGLYTRALENFALAQRKDGESRLADLTRVVAHLGSSSPDWFAGVLRTLSPDDCVSLIASLLRIGVRQHAALIVGSCVYLVSHTGAGPLIRLFVEQKAWDGLYRFLGQIVEESDDPEVHLRYIESAARTGMHTELERITRESQKYDAEAAQKLLIELRLTDQWPFINACHRDQMTGAMVQHLLETKNLHYLDQYCCRRGQERLPDVLRHLVDVGAGSEYISALVAKVGAGAPIAATVAAAAEKGRLQLLRTWLERRMADGCTDKAMYTGLARIYCDNDEPTAISFVEQNAGRFDALEVGAQCRGKSAQLACAVYAAGNCDEELLQLTTETGMFADQAQYLLKRADSGLWETVLDDERAAVRDRLISALVSDALPSTRNAQGVSVMVKALRNAELPQLTTVLEKLLLDQSKTFADNKHLQNLLLFTCIKGDRGKLVGYIERLGNYDHDEIAKLALEQQLFEDAFEIWRRKPGGEARAIQVLLTNVGSIPRAREYAMEVQCRECWRLLGMAQLREELVPDAIDSLVKADDPTPASAVVAGARRTGQFGDLVRYLQMAKRAASDAETRAVVDTELAYAYARTDRLAELADFVAAPNLAHHTTAGEQCFTDELFAAAEILFTAASNYPRLAATLLRLGRYLAAHDAALKADNTKTWKEVCCASVDAGELRLAQMAAQHVVVVPEELEPLCFYFESRGHWEELCGMLQAGLSHSRAHVGLFTQLGLLYARHRREKLMEHLRLWRHRLNSHRLVAECESYHLWSEVRFLHSSSEDWDKALKVMLDHPVPAWEHELCKEAAQRAASAELCYNCVEFYLESQPELLVDFLTHLTKRLSPERVVAEVRPTGHLSVVQPWLESIQSANLRLVNDALNELYVEVEDYETLRKSLEAHDRFDVGLATKLAGHDLMEMRRVAAWLHRRQRRFREAVEVSKRDRMFTDCIDTAAESGDAGLCEDLLKHLADSGLWECFAACLCSCYDTVRPDVALELAWRNERLDMIMPYLIQVLRELWESRRRDPGYAPPATAPRHL